MSRRSPRRRASPSARERASRRIGVAAKRMVARRREAALLTPLSKHYKDVSMLRDQASIYCFRQTCKLFPHPVEIFAPGGIQVPTGVNYARLLMGKFDDVLRLIERHVPTLRSNHNVYGYIGESPYDLDVTFRRRDYSHDDVVIGLKYVDTPARKAPHLVFFEVRNNNGHPTAVVLDPNGNQSHRYDGVYRHFFGDIPFEVAFTNALNTNDTKALTNVDLKELGFVDSPRNWIEGYCVTISCFYLIDYICTDQWVKPDISHFVRASREWLYSPEENRTGYFSTRTTTIRLIVFARYLAYRICNVVLRLDVGEENRLRKVRFEHQYYEDVRELVTTISVGSVKTYFRDPRPQELLDLGATYFSKLPRQLF